MSDHPDHTLEEVLEAVEKGITKTGTAKVLGCSTDTVLRYARRWKSVDDAFRGKRRELVDLSEMGLRGAVLRGEPWAIAFALRTLGKDEGYAERHEHTGPAGGPIQIQPIDYRAAVAALAPGPVADSLAPGQDEDPGDGAEVG